MKILILCEKLDIDYTSSGIGRSKLIYALSKLDAEIDVLFDQFHPTEVDKVADVNFIRIEKPLNIYSRLTRFSKLGAAMNYFTGQNFDSAQCVKWWSEHVQKLVNAKKYNLIYVLGSGQQWYTFFAMQQVKTKVPFVLNFHDPYPSAYHPEFKTKIHWVEKIRYKKIKSITQKAFKITAPSQMLAQYLEDYYPIKNKRITLPHPGVKLPFYSLSKSTKNKKFTLTHAGLLLSSRNPKNLIYAFLELFKKEPTARSQTNLNIVGPFNVKDQDLEVLFNENSDWIKLNKNRISYPESMQLLQNSDALLLIDFNAEFSPIMLGKLGDYFFLEKPIVALTPKRSETSRLLGSSYPLKAEIDDLEKQITIVENLYQLWKSDDLKTIDLTLQKAYVSEENIRKIFTEEILDKLPKL